MKDDISERKRVEEERGRSQKMLQKILESMPVGVAIIGKDKIVRQANSAALAMMECDSEDQIVGQQCHKTLCPTEEGKCPVRRQLVLPFPLPHPRMLPSPSRAE